jgi:hypothetical protein
VYQDPCPIIWIASTYGNINARKCRTPWPPPRQNIQLNCLLERWSLTQGNQAPYLAITPPTDVLSRAKLLPVYNHVFMALPVNQNIPQSFMQRFSHFLWNKLVDGLTKQKRRLWHRKV